jgi:uncharacterized membrane protein
MKHPGNRRLGRSWLGLLRQREGAVHDELGLERLVFFSDAVFAIAITLLVLEIRLPAGADEQRISELSNQLLALWPRYFSYLISFVTIGGLWISHHRKFRYIRRYDQRLLWINLLALMFTAFLPFPTSILGEFGDTTPGALFYILMVLPTGLLFTWLWAHAVRHGLIDPDLDRTTIRCGTVRNLIQPVVFGLSIPLVFINPYLAEGFWALAFVLLLAL